MIYSAPFKSAFLALRRNKARSILTSIGIIIGVSSVIMMVGFGSSAKGVVRKKIFSFGENAVVVSVSPSKPLTIEDSKKVKSLFFEVKYSSIVTQTDSRISYRNNVSNTMIIGLENDYFDIQGWRFLYGRKFLEEDLVNSQNVVVLGDSVRKKIIGYVDPVGKTILINNKPFRVIGSLKSKGISFTQDDFDDFVAVPITAFHSRLFNMPQKNQLFVSTHSAKFIPDTVEKLQIYFRERNNIKNGQQDDFVIKTDEENVEMANYITMTLSSLLIGIASISLLVGGIGIMNIMLVSVSERTREIGIRMAIGAKKHDILMQFLIESITLCFLGGIAGIILGYIIYFSVVIVLGWEFYFSFVSIAVSFLFTCAVGIFFGYYPARKAAALNPIDALRYE